MMLDDNHPLKNIMLFIYCQLHLTHKSYLVINYQLVGKKIFQIHIRWENLRLETIHDMTWIILHDPSGSENDFWF